MNRAEMVRRIEQHYETFWHGDLSNFDREVAADFVDEGMPAGTTPGPQAVREHALHMRGASDDMKVELLDSVVEGNKVVVYCRWTGTHTGTLFGKPATGRRIEFEGIVIWRFNEAGLVDHRWAVLDQGALMRAIS